MEIHIASGLKLQGLHEFSSEIEFIALPIKSSKIDHYKSIIDIISESDIIRPTSFPTSPPQPEEYQCPLRSEWPS